MNKEELAHKIIDIFHDKGLLKDIKHISEESKSIEQLIDFFEKQIQQDFLKEILPDEKGYIEHMKNKTSYDFGNGFNACLKEIINRAEEKWNCDTYLILKAIQFAKEKHKGQLDDNKEDYFNAHCLNVYKILKLKCQKDINLLCASLLHDTLEDTNTTYEDLVEEFNQDIADLVNEVTHERQKDNNGYCFPRLKTERGIILKFADRLSNLTRMKPWNEERKQYYLKKSKFWKSEK